MAHDHHRHGRHGNPADLALMLKRQLDPARAAWQKPDRVVAALGLRRGQVVAEIGSGPGYFTLRLARAVGPSGRVYAVDPEPAMLQALRERLERSGLHNVTPILGMGDDPLLPPASCHLALIVNAYHHFADGRALLRRLTRALRPRGRVVNVDWALRETPVGPPLERRVAPDTFVRAARGAGLRLIRTRDLLPHQYFLVLERARNARTT
ncbi:MAG TPA: class I SAM-dependent methyltransferase [Methylomirabilota bacterium]|nr:class I SAM-dependent methyltransferase [Methylomirabilota bacterium]